MKSIITSSTGRVDTERLYRMSSLFSLLDGKNLLLFMSADPQLVPCSFTGPDPVPIAKAIRTDKQGDIFLISMATPFLFWKEAFDVAGDIRHLIDVHYNPTDILGQFLPKQAWCEICAGRPY